MNQLILHLLGDYVLQGDYQAQNKRRLNSAAFVHAVTYSLPFLLLNPSHAAFWTILGTHYLIDRYGLARYVVVAKNVFFHPEFWESTNQHIREVLIPRYNTPTGYPAESPAWLSVWLLIAADNCLHITINYAALRWL